MRYTGTGFAFLRACGMLIALPLALTGCPVIVGGGAAAVGVAAAEERSIGAVLDDKTIYADITRLYGQSDINELLIRVDVRVDEGRILLTGDVAQPQTAIEAVRLAWLARGVKEVINEIKVTDTPTSFGSYARDQWVETQIEARLLATKNVRSINYTVEVVDGVAYLLGIAQSDQEMRNVARIASLTEGVKKVVSYVRLKTDPNRSSVKGSGKPPI